MFIIWVNVNPFFWGFGHLLVNMGDLLVKSGSKITKASRRIWFVGEVLLCTRFGGFRQGFLKPA